MYCSGFKGAKRGLRAFFGAAILSAVIFIPLSANAAAAPVPKISVSPASVSFSPIKVGATSAAKTVTVKNTGSGDLTASVSITGADASDFGYTGDISTIASKSSSALYVTFSPTAFGKRVATLSISSNDPRKPTVNVNLTGQAAPPVISASPMSVNFGPVAIGTTSTKTVTIKNTGLSDLDISAVTLAGPNALADFSITGSYPQTIVKGGTLGIPVSFTPDSAGSKSATLAVASNDPKKPTLNVSLKGADKFTLADLVGTWAVQTMGGGDSNNSPFWTRGPFTISQDGSWTDQVTHSDGQVKTNSGTVAISSGGVVSLAAKGKNFANLYMDPDKTVVSNTQISGDGPQISFLVKQAASYATEDLAGNWEFYGLENGPSPLWQRQVLTINPDGTFSGTLTDSNGTDVSTSGTMDIGPDGTVTLENSDPNAQIQINMDADKRLTVGTLTPDDGSGGTEIMVGVKQAASYTQADLEGAWEFQSIEYGAPDTSGNPYAVTVTGVINISSSGAVTGTIKMSTGKTSTVPAGTTASISPNGEVTILQPNDTNIVGCLDAGKTMAVLIEKRNNGHIELTVSTRKAK